MVYIGYGNMGVYVSVPCCQGHTPGGVPGVKCAADSGGSVVVVEVGGQCSPREGGLMEHCLPTNLMLCRCNQAILLFRIPERSVANYAYWHLHLSLPVAITFSRARINQTQVGRLTPFSTSWMRAVPYRRETCRT